MRHGNKINHLGRTTAHRKAMLKNMACSLIEHKRITTTVAKAKELRQFVEPIINKSKEDTMSNRRLVFAYLSNKYAVKELFGNVRSKIIDRNGGYTRILKIGNRLGDNAEMAIIELVDYNELAPGKVSAAKKKSRRQKSKSVSTTANESDVANTEEIVENTEASVDAPVVDTENTETGNE